MKKLFFLIVSILFTGHVHTQTEEAFGGRIITPVKIGNQIWSTANLDVEYYRNGDPIPYVSDPEMWKSMLMGAWCYYDNDPANWIYGKLYNGYAVNDPRGLAPEGWRVARHHDWIALKKYLSKGYSGFTSERVAVGKMRDYPSPYWSKKGGEKELIPASLRVNNNGPDEEFIIDNGSNFSALPGGMRLDDAKFYGINNVAQWWSPDSRDVAHPYDTYQNSVYFDNVEYLLLGAHPSIYMHQAVNRKYGLSVRLVKD